MSKEKKKLINNQSLKFLNSIKKICCEACAQKLLVLSMKITYFNINCTKL